MAERVKRQKTKYPKQPMMIPVGQQPMVYPPQVIAQPQPIYQMQPQPYAVPMMPNISPIPQRPNPVVAVPIGPPVGPPVVLPPQPVVTPTPVPVPVAVPTPVQTPVPVPLPPVVVQAPPQINTPKTVVIKRYVHRDDDCCNIF